MKYVGNSVKDLKIAYIGGGSRGWAWTLMTDLEKAEELIDLVAGAGNYANSPYVISRGEMSDIYRRLFVRT